MIRPITWSYMYLSDVSLEGKTHSRPFGVAKYPKQALTFSKIFNKIQVCFNLLLNEIIKNLDVDNQMSTTCGQYGPNISAQNAYFVCVIVVYFVSFFIEHPVVGLTETYEAP